MVQYVYHADPEFASLILATGTSYASVPGVYVIASVAGDPRSLVLAAMFPAKALGHRITINPT